jgi:hypothetical protein
MLYTREFQAEIKEYGCAARKTVSTIAKDKRHARKNLLRCGVEVLSLKEIDRKKPFLYPSDNGGDTRYKAKDKKKIKEYTDRHRKFKYERESMEKLKSMLKENEKHFQSIELDFLRQYLLNKMELNGFAWTKINYKQASETYGFNIRVGKSAVSKCTQLDILAFNGHNVMVKPVWGVRSKVY